MRFNELDDKDKNYIGQVHSDNTLSWDSRMSILMNKYEISERTVRYWIKKLGFAKKGEKPSEEYSEAKLREYDKSKKRFIITWCQNATPVHIPFLRNIETYADFINADIHVIYGRYKNPTSVFSDKGQEYWDQAVHPYKDANRHDIHKYMSILSDIKVQPTAVNPLTGLEGISGANSCIIGHPKVHLKSLPVLEGHPSKLLMTTGAVSLKNYTDSKAGKKGEFHHTFGFVVVELKDDDTFFVRQVTAKDDGSFTDLYHHVDGETVTKVNTIKALVMGDIHQANIDPNIDKATTDLIDKLEPEHIILHDLFDGESISHHDLKNPITLYKKHQQGKDLLKVELDNTMNWLDSFQKYCSNSKFVIVRSNHDDFIDRWVLNQDWKKDIKNSVEYMEYTKALLLGEADKGIVPYIVDQKFNNEITTLDRDDSYKVEDWELGVHGDVGQNGSRGSLRQFRKLNTKIVVGHYHSPARMDGALSVGTSTLLRLNYNKGASSWMHSHVIIHNDGKAQHILFFNNEYTSL